MKELSDHNSDQFVYLNRSKKRLDNLESHTNSKFLQTLGKKWAKAAIVTLASGSAILFSANRVKADEVDQNQATNVQQENQDQNTEQSQTQNNNQANAENSGQQNNDDQQADTQADDAQTADKAGQKDANGVELPANNQDHVKGNVQDA
ncbi:MULTISPECIES: hypothetical protein [Lactobacillus]|uniref:hypothetical protein n=1 Tax=Lactobacillus sp. HT06-2 TaxID=2080222 RepID=UPI001F18FA14|nr:MULTISPECIES: hypothetical protein [Lactobacillus]